MFMSLKDAAEYLGYKSPRAIEEALARGHLTGYRLRSRGDWRVKKEDLDGLMRPMSASREKVKILHVERITLNRKERR